MRRLRVCVRGRHARGLHVGVSTPPFFLGFIHLVLFCFLSPAVAAYWVPFALEVSSCQSPVMIFVENNVEEGARSLVDSKSL